MTTKQELKEKGFQETVNENGTYVLQSTITDNVKVRTWGNTEDGEVLGVYLYDKPSDKYTQALPLE